MPWGLLNLATGAVLMVFGTSRETSDFWADCLWLWWERIGRHCAGLKRLRIRLDNGPNCASNRRQWIKRLIDFADRTGLEIHLLHYPPYHSQYNPIERVWGVLKDDIAANRLHGSIDALVAAAERFFANLAYPASHPAPAASAATGPASPVESPDTDAWAA